MATDPRFVKAQVCRVDEDLDRRGHLPSSSAEESSRSRHFDCRFEHDLQEQLLIGVALHDSRGRVDEQVCVRPRRVLVQAVRLLEVGGQVEVLGAGGLAAPAAFPFPSVAMNVVSNKSFSNPAATSVLNQSVMPLYCVLRARELVCKRISLGSLQPAGLLVPYKYGT